MLDIAIDNSTQKVSPIDDWPDPRPRAQRAREEFRAAV
jgi:hypothetical protein